LPSRCFCVMNSSMLAFIRRGDAEPLLINVPEAIERHLVRRGPHCVDRRLFMSRSARRDSNAHHDLFLAGESINSLPTFTVRTRELPTNQIRAVRSTSQLRPCIRWARQTRLPQASGFGAAAPNANM